MLLPISTLMIFLLPVLLPKLPVCEDAPLLQTCHLSEILKGEHYFSDSLLVG